MDLNKTNGAQDVNVQNAKSNDTTQNANVQNAKQQSVKMQSAETQNAKNQNVKAQKAKSKNAKKAVGGFLGIRKYIAIGLLMAVMIITAVGFSKWNIHIQQTLTVGKTNAPLLGYVTEESQNAILNRYLKVEYTNVNANGNTENKSTAVSEITVDSFTYNGKPFAVSVSDLKEDDVAATWADWGITFTCTYYQTTVNDGTTTYSATDSNGNTAPTNAGTYICVVTATKENTTLENDTTGKNIAATSEENTTATKTTAIDNLNFLTNPVTDEEKSCAAIVTYTINPQQIIAPTAVEKDYTYTGSEQTFTLSNFDSEKMNVSVSGETARIDETNILATNAGTYTVTVSLKDTTNYVWKDIPENDENNSKDGTNTALTFTWTIDKAPIEKPTLAQNEFEYNASNQSVSLIGFDESIMARDDVSTLTAKDVGSYDVIVKLNNKNYKWSGETELDKANSPITLTWKITKKSLTKPQAITTEYNYTGNLITLSLDGNFDETFMSISGNTATNAGDYTATITIQEKNNCVWADGSTDDITIEWKITKKATLTPTFECTEINSSDVYMEGDVIEVTVTVKDKDGNAADLGDLTLTDSGTNNTLEEQGTGTGTYILKIYVLYNDGKPSNANTNVVFTPQINLTFTSTNTDYSDTEYTAHPGSVTVKPVAYNKSTTQYYGTLNKALNAATSGQAVYLIPGSFITVTETLTVESGVTLYVPYAGETCINTDKLTLHGGNPIDTNAANVKTYRKSQILLTNGANLLITSGAKVYLGAITGTMGVYADYTEITLDTTSHIQVDGSFYCYGYVKELNPVISNTEAGDYQNANDSERYIEVSSSGFLEATMALYYLPVRQDNDKNFGSNGGTLQPLNEKNICPVNVFDFPTLQTYTKLISGAKMDARVHMYAVTSIATKAVDQAITIVRENASNETALFYVSSGYLSFEYKSSGNYTTISQTTSVFLSGNVSIGSLLINLEVLTINTDNYVLPFSYKLRVYALGNSIFTIDKKTKLMPGAFIQINEGATVVVSSEVVIHTASSTSYIAFYANGCGDAQFINNGTLTLTSTGKLGGLLSTTQKTQKAKCDFSAITTKDSFTVTVYEGNEQTPVTYTAKGEFFDTATNQAVMAYFVPGTIITSYGDGSRWQGEMNSTSTLTVTKTNSNLICDYEVYLADDQNGTNATQLSSDDGKTFLITNNKWLKVTTYFCTNAVFTLSANNETFTSNAWYQVLGDYKLSLTGSEAVNLFIQSTSKSGASSVVYQVYCAETENGTYRLMNTITCEGNTSLVKNSWYYVDSDKASFKEGEFKAPTEKNGSEFTCSTKYQIATDTHIEIGTSSGCLVEGTLITLADGSKKKVEDLLATDVLLAFNHETGQYVAAPLLANVHGTQTAEICEVITLTFTNGKKLEIVAEHGLYDKDLNKYVYLNAYNANDFIGHNFVTSEYVNNTVVSSTTKLVAVTITNKYTRYYNPATVWHINLIANDMLTLSAGMVNLFAYDENMKYDELLMQQDIAKYGLYTYEDFKNYTSEEVFNVFPFKYYKVAVGKGEFTFEKLLWLLDFYNADTTVKPSYDSSNNIDTDAEQGGNDDSSLLGINSGGGEDNASYSAAKEAAFLPTSADKDNSSAALLEDS